jgi:RimJ/RimL family protein N-acetyltransferase
LFELVGDRSAQVGAWAKQNYGADFGTVFTAIGVLRDGEIVGAAILNDYANGNIEFSYFGPGSASLRIIRAVAHTAFVINGCDRVSATTLETNDRAIEALVKLGFRHEGTRRMPEGKPNWLLFGILRNECRFLK